jgi:hypothetical protein
MNIKTLQASNRRHVRKNALYESVIYFCPILHKSATTQQIHGKVP